MAEYTHDEKMDFLYEFAKNYHISGVPRYMIFDKEGRIVTVDAPNPTTDKLKQLILKTLQYED